MTIINKKNCYERDKYCGIVKLKVSGWTFQKRVATGCFALKILCQILVHIVSLDLLLLIKKPFLFKTCPVLIFAAETRTFLTSDSFVGCCTELELELQNWSKIWKNVSSGHVSVQVQSWELNCNNGQSGQF